MTSKDRHEGRYQRRKAKREVKQKERTAEWDNYDKVFTFEHLYAAAEKCYHGVGWKESTQKFRVNTICNVSKICSELKSGKYKSKGFHEFNIIERGKPRHIQSVHISERVMQRCLCDYSLVPMLERSLIFDNGACIEGKGVKFTTERLKIHLRQYHKEHGTEGYVLMLDFSHYFDNINHELLKKLIAKKYTDERLIRFIDTLIDNFKGKNGLGLGSQISQICALAFPDKLDHIIKEKLHIKHYGRYMDDAYLISNSKDELRHCLEVIKIYCVEHKIILNEKKTQIRKLSQGIPFLKRRFILTNTGKVLQIPVRKSVTKMRHKLKAFTVKVANGKMTIEDITISFTAWKSHMKSMNSYFALRRTELQYQKIITGGQP